MKSLLFEMTTRLFIGPRLKESKPIFGSILGIALSMIPLVVVIFLSDGMIRGITDRYIETGTFHIQLRPYESFSEEEWASTERVLHETEGIRLVEKEHSGMGLAYAGNRQTAVSIRSLDPGIYDSDSSFRKYLTIIEGEFDLKRDDQIILGRETADQLNLRVGDSIKILTGKTLSNGKFIPKISRFTVMGIFTTGYQDLDRLWVFIDLNKGMKILQDSESSSQFLIKVDEPYADLTPQLKEIRKALGNQRWGLYTWQSLNRSQQSNYQTTKLILILIMALIVLVAIMNISSSMIMLVMENEQEIGILKSMGMGNSFLSLQYILTAGIAGGTGSLLGIGAGTLIVVNFNSLISFLEKIINSSVHLFYNLLGFPTPPEISLLSSQYYLEQFSINIDGEILIIIFVLTLALSMAAALIPVRHIGKIIPLEILRKH
ncbi:ABC transporter permease [Oceanispirochaeta crateris]|uniref:ABC transporter permease n=1 Tax=Oceanispirochaeta crateris TaxID=2518645 RepID=A0A5C1QMS4_9SPIO|nr:ABC transporter permease [Oceanispirochaeta crateris]QEN07462.1 ABC transporter permease [Oceanispirochaeta crateris]